MRSGFAIVAESDGQHPDDRKTNENEKHYKPKPNEEIHVVPQQTH